MGLFDRISEGLARSRDRFKEQMNVLLDRGPDLDEEFWEDLEETLVLSDIGGGAASEIVEGLRDTAVRKALPDAYAVLDLLNDRIADAFATGGGEVLSADRPWCCSWASTARARPPRWASSPRRPRIRAARCCSAARIRFAQRPSSSSRSGRGARAWRWSRASAAAIRPACATTPSIAPSGKAPSSCSSTRRDVCTPRPTSCASSRGGGRGAQALKASRVHRARHRRHHRPERPAAGPRVRPRPSIWTG